MEILIYIILITTIIAMIIGLFTTNYKLEKISGIATIIGLILVVILTLVKPSSNDKLWFEDNKCPYEGAECPNAREAMRMYQIDVNSNNDSIYLYDADLLLGKCSLDQLDSLMIKALQ